MNTSSRFMTLISTPVRKIIHHPQPGKLSQVDWLQRPDLLSKLTLQSKGIKVSEESTLDNAKWLDCLVGTSSNVCYQHRILAANTTFTSR
jgi:hypothetical protein